MLSSTGSCSTSYDTNAILGYRNNVRSTLYKSMHNNLNVHGHQRAPFVRAQFQPQVDPDRELRRNMPSAPPPRAPPPPPPPPPPPLENLTIDISRRQLFGIMAGGSLAWYAALKAGVPITAVDRKRGIALLKTRGGNIVAATQDEQGRMFLFDKLGNIYYDTEDPRLGMYIVDTGGEMFNEFVDNEGKVQQVYVGNLADLRSVKVKEVGGVDVKDLQKSVKGFRNGRIVAFPKTIDPANATWADALPPNAPAGLNKDGDKVEPPAFLEDLEIEIEPRGLFGGNAKDIDLFEQLKTMK